MLLVALLLGLERRAQSRLRFGQARGGRSDTLDARPLRLRAAGVGLAWLVCGVPVLLGFVLPVLFMLRPLLADGHNLPWGSFVGWAINSLRLASISAGSADGDVELCREVFDQVPMKPRILLSQSIVTLTTSAIFHGMKTGRLIHSPMMPSMIDLHMNFGNKLLWEVMNLFANKACGERK